VAGFSELDFEGWQTPQVPPILLQCLHEVHDLQAVQEAEPVHLLANAGERVRSPVSKAMRKRRTISVNQLAHRWCTSWITRLIR
jgi:hypothetical protein